ncbi:MAG: right-handed parallel beta-helix repeat-containing protein [Candidatus Diapherotrites archaeon]
MAGNKNKRLIPAGKNKKLILAAIIIPVFLAAALSGCIKETPKFGEEGGIELAHIAGSKEAVAQEGAAPAEEKECEVKEDCPDRLCLEKACVDYKCPYSETTPCCGNGKCEPGETYKECAGDCVKTGRFRESEVWGGTIHVTGDIWVEEGATLTILPGTVIEVAAMSDDQHGGADHARDPPFPNDPDRIETRSTRIFVGGILNAIGTPDNRILFTSDSKTPTTYDWDGLSINHGKLEYAIVEYARYNNFQHSSDVVVANSTFRNMLECCICIGHSGAISPQILHNDIYNCGHECIDYAGGSALIKGNHFHLENPEIQPDPSRGGNGIIVYRNAYPAIEDNVFEKHSRAIFFLDNSLNEEEPGNRVIVRNNTMKSNDMGIDIDPGYPADAIIMENN